MDLLSWAILSPEAAMAVKSGLRVLHFLGLVLGLGAATLLDLIFLRFLATRQVSPEHFQIVEFSSKVVSFGLVLLWISGLGFLLHYGAFDPAKLGNEKVWAKMAIVGILTLNGVFIHRAVLPVVHRNIGRSLFDGLGRRQRSLLLVSGVVSGTSWYVPLLLGSIPQLNFVVPAWIILATYGGLLTAGILLTHGVAHIALPREVTGTVPAADGRPTPVHLRRPWTLLGRRQRSPAG
jgi:hypothetical protein